MKSQVKIAQLDYDSFLGTPTSQQIIRLLSIWGDLAIKEIVAKLSVRESQIHYTLSNLRKIGVVEKIRRGNYKLTDTPFAQHMKDAFISNSTNIISETIYNIHQLLKQADIDRAQELFEQLVALYDPILKTRFSYNMNSLAHSFLEYYETE